MDINNKNKNTISNKIRRCSTLIQYIYNTLMEDKDIQRYLYYNTYTPLSNRGKNYDGKIISQPEITNEDIEGLLFDSPFNPDTEIDLNNYIFINLNNGKFTAKQNLIFFEVNILVPEKYSKISNGYRYFEIAQKVADILDQIYVEGDFAEDLGNIQPILYAMPVYRLSKTNDIIWVNMQFEVEIFPFGRVRT